MAPLVLGRTRYFFGIHEIEDVGERIALAGQIGAAQGDGDDLRAAGGQGVAHQFRRGELAGADEEPRMELPSGNEQRCAKRKHREEDTVPPVGVQSIKCGCCICRRRKEEAQLFWSAAACRRFRKAGPSFPHSKRLPEQCRTKIFTIVVGQSCRSALNSWAARQRPFASS